MRRLALLLMLAAVPGRTAQTSYAGMKALHQRYKGSNSEFTSPTRHCTLHLDLWQVSTDTGLDPKAAVHYFLMRALPPFRFTIDRGLRTSMARLHRRRSRH